MRRLLAANNGGEGLFYCVRATHSILEDSEFVANAGNGINVGNRDTDQVIRRNVIRDNGGAGLLFRELDYAVAAHRCQVLENRLENNCAQEGKAEIDLQAELEGMVVRDNEIRPREGKTGLRIAAQVRQIEIGDNQIEAPTDAAIVDERQQQQE